MNRRCRDEVIQMHQFFESWFSARVPDADEAFERCQRALAPGFRLITPSGSVVARDQLCRGLRAAHGERPSFRIWIEDYCHRALTAGLSLVTYTEWQDTGGDVTSRISTALMAEEAAAPAGVVWLHVHETWAERPRAAGNATDALIARFEAGDIAPAEMTHAMHVELAWRYVRAYPVLQALERLIAAIRAFAATHGKTTLYHETITWAYTLLVNQRVAQAPPSQTWDEFAAANPDLMQRGKHMLERYYRDDTLWSPLARQTFVFPDRVSPATPEMGREHDQ